MTHIVGNTFIPSNQERKPIDPQKLEGLFSDGVPKIAHEEPLIRTKRVKNITSENLNTLESIDIKAIWEEIKPARKLSSNPGDGKAIQPSRSSGETNHGGQSIIPQNVNSIFDPDRIDNIKNSEFSTHARQAGQEARDRKANKGKPTAEAREEWEIIGKAKTTANTPVTDRGVMPNRTGFQQSEIPHVKIKSVEKIIAQNKQSAKAGQLAAGMKMDLDKIMMEKQNRINNNWEEEALSNIKEATTRKMETHVESIKFSENFVSEPKKGKNKINLNGLFASPEDPSEGSDPSIKRNSNQLKADIKTRKDDRSWETVSKSRKM